MLPLVLYDIPSKLPGNSWSLNTAKTRLVLGYKGLPFETVWVEYPDIAPKLKEIGASPNKFRSGKELYTVPVLNDPNTGATITDSWVIAEYLDRTYPEKPVFPNGTKGLISVLDPALHSLLDPSDAFGLILLHVSQILNERSSQYFIPTREASMQCPVNEWSPEGGKREAHWATIKDYYCAVKTWYEREEGKWFMGDTFSYADIIIASHSFWHKRALRDEWERVAALHDRYWEFLLTNVEKECKVDENFHLLNERTR